jgi:hypothetical protein
MIDGLVVALRAMVGIALESFRLRNVFCFEREFGLVAWPVERRLVAGLFGSPATDEVKMLSQLF